MADAAPLIDIPAAPVPERGGAEWFKGADGARLRAALFQPAAAPRGSVVVSPGRTEAIEKYFEVVRELQDRGFVVLVHDWRGQGLSARLLKDRLKGHARGFRPFVADLRELLDVFGPRLPKPWLTIGHSMGGCLTLMALALGEERFDGAVLSAPMLGLLTGPIPHPVGVAIAATLSTVGLGGLPMAARSASPIHVAFEDNILTHDAARYARNQAQIDACSDLALGGPTWGWLNFAFSAIALLSTGKAVTQIKTPLVVVAAMADKIISVEATRAVTARVPGSRFVEAPGAYHEILQETDDIRAVFWREFDALAARIAPKAL